jgi:acetyltransferase
MASGASSRVKLAERGINTPLQGTVSQWIFQTFEYSYHQDDASRAAKESANVQANHRSSLSGLPSIAMPPTSYPAEWERAAITRDGVPYRIRPIRTEDAQLECAFIRGLSEESRYSRLMYSLSEPYPALIDRLVNVDYERTMAFVAVAGATTNEQFIGIARYAADPSGSACEFAVVVADAWQSRGIGTVLARLLFEYARSQRFTRIYGTILAGNQRMIELAHWIGLETRPCPDDSGLVEASLTLGV